MPRVTATAGSVARRRRRPTSSAADGSLTLEHVERYNAEAKDVAAGRASPAIIPDSTNPDVRERQLTANDVGNVR